MKARQGAWRWLRRAGIALAALLLLVAGFAAGAEGSPVLIADSTLSDEQIDSGGGNVLGSEFPRERVRSVTFVDTLAHAPSDAWDVSAAGDRSVLAWLAPRGELADLYIGGAGGVALNEDSSFLFANYTALEIVRFNGCVDASGARSLYAMFYNCSSLREVNLVNFDTSSATNMGYMFENCASLESLDLRSFDTSNVTDMSYMFAYCPLLGRVDAGESFFPAGVQGAGNMFVGSGVNSVAGQTPMGESILMADAYEDDALDGGEIPYVLGSEIPRSAVRSVRFADSLAGAPEDAWDVSAAGDGSVLAWATPDGEMYNLTLAGSGGVILSSGQALFSGYSALEEIDFNGCVDTSRVGNMRSMFRKCARLESLDLSGFDTAHVTTMLRMFEETPSLRSVELSSFDTSRVTTLAGMFSGCASLESLDLSGFHTESVEDMNCIFANCAKLTRLQLNPDSFTTARVQNMNSMFYGCASLDSLDVSWFDTSSARSMYAMFYRCSSLSDLNLQNFDTASVTNMRSMFSGCAGLTSLDLRNFDTANVTDMNYMFADCGQLKQILASEGFIPDGVQGADNMFNNSGVNSITTPGEAQDEAPGDTQDEAQGDAQSEPIRSVLRADACGSDALTGQEPLYVLGSEIPRSAVRSVRFSGDLSSAPEDAWDASQAGDGSVLAWATPSGELYDLTLAGDGKVIIENGNELFAKYDHMEELDFNGCVDASANSGMEAMFYNCQELDALDLSGLETGRVTDMSMTFFNCAGLTSLDLSGFDTGRVTTMALMFAGCNRLESLDLSGFDTRRVRDMQHQFHTCVSLTSLNLSGFDTSGVTNMEGQFFGCASLTSLDLSNFDTSGVTNMSGMFNGCWSLAELNILNFDTRNVTDMSEMFRETRSLPDVKVGENFIVGDDVKRDDMFEGSMMSH